MEYTTPAPALVALSSLLIDGVLVLFSKISSDSDLRTADDDDNDDDEPEDVEMDDDDSIVSIERHLGRLLAKEKGGRRPSSLCARI